MVVLSTIKERYADQILLVFSFNPIMFIAYVYRA